jgi:hypothetical protein
MKKQKQQGIKGPNMNEPKENVPRKEENEEVVSTEGTAKKKQPKSPSRANLNLEKYKNAQDELRKKGLQPTQRNIHKLIGGSYSTIGKLERQLVELNSETIDTSITVSEETKDALQREIIRHLEANRDSMNEKLAKVAQCDEILNEASDTIKNLQDIVSDLNAENIKLRALLDSKHDGLSD